MEGSEAMMIRICVWLYQFLPFSSHCALFKGGYCPAMQAYFVLNFLLSTLLSFLLPPPSED